MRNLNICFLGLSITSSWGNGHATTFRAIIKQLHLLGHHIDFLERDVPWYASHRDLPNPEYCTLHLYQDLPDLQRRFANMVEAADLVILGSYVPEGVKVGKWLNQTANGIIAFYDIDTPVTLAKIAKGDYEYLHPDLIPMYDIYLSFTGGPILNLLENKYGSPLAQPFYCSVDPDIYFPEETALTYDLGYLGTYSDDRQPPLNKLLVEAAQNWQEGKFAVVGPQYPNNIHWPKNVYRNNHLPPSEHRKFYNSQRFTLNITRSDMVEMGHSPSVRLFEAAACGVPIISDYWKGLDKFFSLNQEILIADDAIDTIRYLREVDENQRKLIGERARKKVLKEHTSAIRAKQLIQYVAELEKPTVSHF